MCWCCRRCVLLRYLIGGGGDGREVLLTQKRGSRFPRNIIQDTHKRDKSSSTFYQFYYTRLRLPSLFYLCPIQMIVAVMWWLL